MGLMFVGTKMDHWQVSRAITTELLTLRQNKVELTFSPVIKSLNSVATPLPHCVFSGATLLLFHQWETFGRFLFFQSLLVFLVLVTYVRSTEYVRACSELQKRTVMSVAANVSKVSHYSSVLIWLSFFSCYVLQSHQPHCQVYGHAGPFSHISFPECHPASLWLH